MQMYAHKDNVDFVGRVQYDEGNEEVFNETGL